MAEKGIKPQQEIDLQIPQNRFRIDGVDHPIKLIPEEGPAAGITVEAFVITDELGEKMDVAKITFEPGASVIEFFRGDRWIQDFIVEGKGWWVLLDDQGQTHVVEIDTEKNKGFLLAEYKTGWVASTIAAKDGPGLVFIEVSSPPWDPNEFDKIVDINDSRLTDEFRETYQKLH